MNLATSHIHKGGAIALVLGNQGLQLHFPVQKIQQGTSECMAGSSSLGSVLGPTVVLPGS